MDRVNELLDKCKTTMKAPTDMALAKMMGVTRSTMSSWRNGARYPDAVACARIAEITGEPLQKVLGIVGEARALSAEEKRVWRRLAEVATLAGVMLAGAVMPYPAAAASGGIEAEQDAAICIMRSEARRLSSTNLPAPSLTDLPGTPPANLAGLTTAVQPSADAVLR